MNDRESIWNRILAHCSTNLNEPEFVFITIRGLEFFIVRVDENTVHPYRIGANPVLFNISRNRIYSDIKLDRPVNHDRPRDYKTPAPSYRYALLNDKRIFLKN